MDLAFTTERIGLVCPIYGHELPAMVKEFLRKATFHTEYFYDEVANVAELLLGPKGAFITGADLFRIEPAQPAQRFWGGWRTSGSTTQSISATKLGGAIYP